MSDVKLDLPDITVIVDSGNEYSTVVNPSEIYLVDVKAGDSFEVKLNQPQVITVDGSGSYYKVADFSISSSFTQTSSYAVSSSYSVSSSYAQSGSYAASASISNISISSSYAETSSYYRIDNTIIYPSQVTSSFYGDGSGLTNVPTTLTVRATTGSDEIHLLTDTLTFSGSNGITTFITDNVIGFKLPDNLVSESAQISYDGLQNIPIGIVSSSTQFKTLEDPFTGSFEAKTLDVYGGLTNVRFSSSRHDGIIGETRSLYPFMSTTLFAGTSIEYNAQRNNSTRTGTIIASWADGIPSYTDISNVDVGDTWDLSFEVICTPDNALLRAYSLGSGSGAWNIQLLFKLFPLLS